MKNRFFCRLAKPKFTGSALLLLSTFAHAQAPVIVPPQLDTSRQRVPNELPTNNRLPGLPEAPVTDVGSGANPAANTDEKAFFVQHVKVQGATVYSLAELQQIMGLSGNAMQTLSTLQAAAERLEKRYRDDGYFLSQVFIPPQVLDEGVVNFAVVEGYVSDIQLEGLEDGRRTYAQGVSEPVLAQKPLNIATLEKAMLLLNDAPGMKARSVLKPSSTPGASSLVLIVENSDNSHTLAVNNTNSTITGPWTMALSSTVAQPLAFLTSRPHALQTTLSGSGGSLRESRVASVRLSTPVGYSGTLASIGALYANAHPGGAPGALGISSESSSLAPRVRVPLKRGRNLSVYLDTGLAINRSETRIGAVPLTADQTSVFDLGFSAVNIQNTGTATVGTVTLAQGLPVLGAMTASAPNPSVAGFNPDFNKLNASISHNQFINKDWSLFINSQMQMTNDKLLTGELIAFGGNAVGRGFKPSTLVGDEGVGGLVELRYQLAQQWLTYFNTVQLYLFADQARAKSRRTAALPETNSSLRSYGVGLRFKVQRAMYVDLSLANASYTDINPVPINGTRVLLSVLYEFQ